MATVILACFFFRFVIVVFSILFFSSMDRTSITIHTTRTVHTSERASLSVGVCLLYYDVSNYNMQIFNQQQNISFFTNFWFCSQISATARYTYSSHITFCIMVCRFKLFKYFSFIMYTFFIIINMLFRGFSWNATLYSNVNSCRKYYVRPNQKCFTNIFFSFDVTNPVATAYSSSWPAYSTY